MKKNSFLVVGKLTQLGAMLKLQIIAGLEKKGLIETKDQVTFCTEVDPTRISKQRVSAKANHILLLGLKSHVLPECIEKIHRSIPGNENVAYLVVAPEGNTPTFNKELPVTTYLTVDDFSKQKMAA